MTLIEKLIERITTRLSAYELLAEQGVIPGQLDTYELEQLIGRIKELKSTLDFIMLNSDHIDTSPIPVEI